MLILFSTAHIYATPGFGTDGLKGLDAEQQKKLAEGQILFTVGEPSTSDRASGKPFAFIEAAMVMDKPPAETWEYLSKAEDQHLYLRETESSTVLYLSPDQSLLEYRVKVLLIGTSFRLFHYFDRARFIMTWKLDPDYDNGLREFRGFWYLYPFEGNRTLARYGNYVSLAGIPDFIVKFFMKGGITRSLESVRLYVESSGTYRK